MIELYKWARFQMNTHTLLNTRILSNVTAIWIEHIFTRRTNHNNFSDMHNTKFRYHQCFVSCSFVLFSNCLLLHFRRLDYFLITRNSHLSSGIASINPRSGWRNIFSTQRRFVTLKGSDKKSLNQDILDMWTGSGCAPNWPLRIYLLGRT